MDDKRIGNFIRKLREEAGMSQGELAALCYVSRTVEGRWELGKIGVTSQNLVYLSKIFGVSVDELLAGERKKKNLAVKISEITLNMIDRNARLSKLLKLALIGILLLALIFFTYFFYTFYNSIQVYKIYFDSNKYTVDYGLVTKMKDKVYFYLDVNYAIDNVDDIEEVHLYYEDNSNVKTLKKITNIQPFIIVDYLGYEEYFDFKNFGKILDNMYLEIKLKNEGNEKVKISFKRDYANNKAFLNRNNSSIKNKEVNENNNSKTEIFSKFQKIKEIAKNNGDENYFEYMLEGNKYELFIFPDNLVIYFIQDAKQYSFKYACFESQNEFFYLNSYVNDEEKELYQIDIKNETCENGNCSNFKLDYNQFINIINSIINEN